MNWRLIDVLSLPESYYLTLITMLREERESRTHQHGQFESDL